jgi:hypothetical protein
MNEEYHNRRIPAAATDLGDLAGSSLYLGLCRIDGVELDELSRIDALTPVYRRRMNRMSIQKRRMLAGMVRYGKPVKVKEMFSITRIVQHGHNSSLAGRLVQDGFLQKQPDGRYFLSEDMDPDFVRYLYARLTEFSEIWRSDRSEELIPDRENPITYFIEHREEIRQKRGQGQRSHLYTSLTD